MKLTVIGYWHAFPAAGGATSGFLLEKDNFRLLLDCGSGVVSHLQKYCSLNDLDAVILSHYHQDHIADVGVLQYGIMMNTYLGKRSKPLTIYGHTLDIERFQKLSYESFVNGESYNPSQSLQIGPFTIEFIKTIHPAPCFAMRISDGLHNIVYTADTDYFPELTTFSKECDLLITECSFYAGQTKAGGHMTSEDVGQLSKEAKPKTVLLTHLPHYGNHEDLVKQVKTVFHGDVQLAKLGWTKAFH